jgi:hypothetical protein
VPPVDFRLGDIVRLRRPHPCGNEDFEVVRLGADIGLSCTRCGRRILLPRSTVERRIVQFVRRNAESELPTDLDPPARPTSLPPDQPTGP